MSDAMARTNRSASPTQPSRRGPAAWTYAWWLVVGAVLGTGVAGILTIGIFLLPLAGIMIILGVLIPRLSNESQLAAIAGLALPTLYLAWLYSRGPGTVCTDGGDTCEDLYSPWPFVAAAVVLVVLSIVLIRAARPTRRP
jgi:hypothetical protein